jgi:hypothetical protein
MTGWLQQAAREHRLPLLILVVPIFWVVYQSDAETAVPLLILPVAAFLVGAALRPRHVWLVWLGAVVIQWIAMGVLGKYNDPGPDETVVSLILEAFAWMAFGVLLPVWLGRFASSGLMRGRRPENRLGA